MIRFLEANGYDVSYVTGVDTDRQRSAAPEPQGVRLERPRRVLVGRAARRTSRPRATPASTSRSSAATRCSGRRAGNRASTARTRRTARWSPTRRRTSTRRSTRRTRGRGPARGATRASARRPTAASPRTRSPASTSSSTRAPSGHQGARGPTRKLRFWRNTAVATLAAGADADARRRHRHARLRVGRRPRQRLPARRADRPVVDDVVNVRRDVHRLRHRRHDQRRATHNLTLYRAPQRRAGLRRRHRAVVLGPRRRTDHDRRHRARPRTCSRRRSTCSPTWASSRRPLHRRARRPRRRRPTRRRRPRRSRRRPRRRNAHRRQRRSRSPARPPTPAAASSPASRSRPTAAPPGTRRDGHHQRGPTRWIVARQPDSTTIKTRAVDDSGNIETPGAGTDGQRHLPVLDLGRATRRPAIVDAGDGDSVELGREVHVATSPARSPASASTRRRPTPAPTSATSGRATGTLLAHGAPSRARPPRVGRQVNFSTPGRDQPEHDLRRVVPRARTATTPTTELLLQPAGAGRQHARQPAAARRRQRPATATASTRTRDAARSRPAPTSRSNYWVDVALHARSARRHRRRT